MAHLIASRPPTAAKGRLARLNAWQATTAWKASFQRFTAVDRALRTLRTRLGATSASTSASPS